MSNKSNKTFKHLLNITNLYVQELENPESGQLGSAFWDIKELSITAQVGGVMTCSLVLLPDYKDKITTYEMEEERQNAYLESGYAAVFCSYSVDNNDNTYSEIICCLFRGLVYSHSNMVSMSGNSYTYGRGVELVSDLKTLDTLPLGSLFQGRLDEGNKKLAQSRFGVANSTLSLLAAAEASAKAAKATKQGLVIGSFTASILDNGFTTAQTGDKKGSTTLTTPNRKIADAIDVDSSPIISIKSNDSNGYTGAYMEIANTIASSYGSTPPITIFAGILSSYYQMLVPRFPETCSALSTAENKTKIVPNLAWKKETIDTLHKISLADIMYLQQYTNDGKPNEINGVVVDASLDSEKRDGSFLESYYICAENKATGKLDVKKSSESGGAGVVYDRLVQTRLPRWIQYDIFNGTQSSEEFRKSWAEFIARVVYSSMNRVNDKLTVSVPLTKFLDIRNYIGDLFEIAAPSDSSGTMIGRLDAVNFKMTVGESINYSANLSFTHIRTKEEAAALSVDVKGFVTNGK